MKNYYRILQVDPSAESEVIESAYKRLARKYHPDTNRSADATLRMKEINEAYEVLGDPTRRAEYDRTRGRASEQRGAEHETDKQQASQKPPSRPEPSVPTGLVCPNCGQRIPLNEIYCQKCLYQLKVARFCANCGKSALDGAKFCLNCGRILA